MSTPASPIELSGAQFARLRDQLAAFGGIYLDDGQRRRLEAALADRLAQQRMDLDDYDRHIATQLGRDELRQLAELVLNHETSFFRNQPHMRTLGDVVLPALRAKQPPDAPIRLWSAGCSTGEEPYSLAMALLDALPGGERQLEVIGSDLSHSALDRARDGIYRGRALANLDQRLLARHFCRLDDGYQVNDRLRQMVAFRWINLLEPLPADLGGVDAIFCQNVMIYFRQEARQRLVERFYQLLPVGGALFLGFSETLWNVFDGFEARTVSGSYVYYKVARPRLQQVVRQLAPRRQPASAPIAGPQDGEDAARLARGRSLAASGELTAATEELQQIAGTSPLAIDALVLLARGHADRDELELAAAESLRAIAIDPLRDEIYLLLGTIYARQGQWQAAIAQFERARYLQPAAPLASYRLAEAYAAAGRSEQAAREYRSALRKLARWPADELIDGIAAAWLRQTCEQQLARRGGV